MAELIFITVCSTPKNNRHGRGRSGCTSNSLNRKFNMSQHVQNGEQSPFDQIKRIDELDNEYWSARDLQGLIEYEDFRNLEDAILKAKRSIVAHEEVSAGELNIGSFTKIVEIGHGTREVRDYKLTRFGAYRVLQECDASKRVVASAKTYFAATAEVMESRPKLEGTLGVLQEALYEIDRTNRRVDHVELIQDQQVAAQRELSARLDGIEGRSDWYVVLAYCKLRNIEAALSFRQELGRVATGICTSRGITPGKAPDERYKSVNSYPVEILDEAYAQVKAYQKAA